MKIVLGAYIDEAVENSKKVGLYADDVRETDTSNLFLFHEYTSCVYLILYPSLYIPQPRSVV